MSLPSSRPGWTEPRVETLTRLWQSGLSAAQVARTLGGVSRNAVIGKLHRLGLAGRPTPTLPRPIRAARTPVRPARRTDPRPDTPRSAVAASAAAAEVIDLGPTCDLAALPAHACRWPIGDPREDDFGFCGRPAEGAGPYCQAHSRRARRPGAEPLERDPVLRRLLAGSVR